MSTCPSTGLQPWPWPQNLTQEWALTSSSNPSSNLVQPLPEPWTKCSCLIPSVCLSLGLEGCSHSDVHSLLWKPLKAPGLSRPRSSLPDHCKRTTRCGKEDMGSHLCPWFLICVWARGSSILPYLPQWVVSRGSGCERFKAHIMYCELLLPLSKCQHFSLLAVL